nr:PCNA-interacting partner-like [Chelonoidis abingdonii]
MKQPLIRSQFACTYKDDLMTEKKGQHFFSRSQIPTCVHPAPKQMLSLCLEAETFSEGVKSPPERPALGTSSENVLQNRSKSEKVKSCQPRNKSSKRKHMALNSEKVICNNENEPSQYTNVKRPKISNILQEKLDSRLDGAPKSNKATAKNKLIAGFGGSFPSERISAANANRYLLSTTDWHQGETWTSAYFCFRQL